MDFTAHHDVEIVVLVSHILLDRISYRSIPSHAAKNVLTLGLRANHTPCLSKPLRSISEVGQTVLSIGSHLTGILYTGTYRSKCFKESDVLTRRWRNCNTRHAATIDTLPLQAEGKILDMTKMIYTQTTELLPNRALGLSVNALLADMSPAYFEQYAAVGSVCFCLCTLSSFPLDLKVSVCFQQIGRESISATSTRP